MMKKFVFLFLLVACSNPKGKIVDRQKKLTQMIEASRSLEEFYLIDKKIDSLNYYQNRTLNLKAEYDSLEWELKKY